MSTKKRVWLAQQGVWDMALESMPLACGYLKATAEADETIRREMDIRIFNFGGGHSTLDMVRRMLIEEVPDIIAFSVLGWNQQRFAAVANTFRQINPSGWTVFGGTHVAHQDKRVFGSFPAVDVIVNGEGEFTFRDILSAYLVGKSRHELDAIDGISFRRADGEIVKTKDRPRIADLNTIPSPFLTGAIPMVNQVGEFAYDVALMETSRGCPYSCAFCYWGGATGQKLRSFTIERLEAEIELFAHHKVANMALCDSNFGMLSQDERFIEAVIKAKQTYGFPKHVESSWAKNKGKVFYNIVRRMRQAGLHSSFTLALQSLSDVALELMRRTNMKVNEWEDLAAWLRRDGFGLYAELIWSVPGETYDSFITGYDKLAQHVSRIATYPLLLIPNIEYSENRHKYEFVSVHGDKDDYEYVLAHKTMTFAENARMHRFLFWARVMGEYIVFQWAWAPLRRIAGMTQSQVMLSLDAWIDTQTDQISKGLQACRAEVVDHLDASRVTRGIHFFAVERAIGPLLERWWEEEIIPKVPEQHRPFFRDLLRYDLAIRPLYAPQDVDDANPSTRAYTSTNQEELAVEHVDGELYFVRRGLTFAYSMPDAISQLLANPEQALVPEQHRIDLYYKGGFHHYLDNHEQYPQFMGKTHEQLTQRAAVAEDEPVPRRGQPVLRVLNG